MSRPAKASKDKVRAAELAGLPVFTGLPTNQLTKLARLFRRARFSVGERVFAAGDAASQLYVLEAGEVVIRFLPDDGGWLDIATLYPGSAFGWSAAMQRARYTASAICCTDVRAITIQASALSSLVTDDPELHAALLERVAKIAASRANALGRQVIQSLAVSTDDQPGPKSRQHLDTLLIPRQSRRSAA